MRAFQCGQYAFHFGEQFKGIEDIIICGGDILRPGSIFKPAVFGADGGIIEACAY